jgi:indolepyruvate ferredoxin oxidoreductase
MNQTGLAQKFGPVVSHLRIAKRQQDIHAVRIPAGDADLVIGCDLAVSATDDALAKLNIDRSYAVINDTMMPTAEFVHNPDAVFHATPMKESIRHELAADRVNFLPATELASALLGDTIATNLFMVGYAYQKGLIPLTAAAIFKALELNAVAVEFNQQAFIWGRRAAVDLEQVEVVAGVREKRFNALQTVDEIVDFRCKELVSYQDQAYADRYKSQVEKVIQAEQALNGEAGDLSAAVAKALHKLMAYKDEYEVARLYTDGRFQAKLKNMFEDGYKLKIHLAPPLFSRRDPDTGHLRKKKFGGYILGMFKLLAPLKFLRGSKLDIFGYSAERKMERGLIGELDQTIDTLLAGLTPDKLQHAVEIVELALDVRGFGHVKEANYEQYQLRLAQQLKRYKNKFAIQVEVSNVA